VNHPCFYDSRIEDMHMTQHLIFLFAFAISAALPGPEIAALLSRSIGGGLRSSLPPATR